MLKLFLSIIVLFFQTYNLNILMLGLELKKIENLSQLDEESISRLYDLMSFYNIAKGKAAITTRLRPYLNYKDYELSLITLKDVIIGTIGLKIEKEIIIIDFIVITENLQRKGIARTVVKALPLKYNVKRMNIVPRPECVPVFEKLGFIANKLKFKSRKNVYTYIVNK